MDAVDIAMICHEANRALCAAHNDFTQPTWVDAPEWQQESALGGVMFHLANPEATAADSHLSWYRQKEAEGWTYGKVKNPFAKQHPCMVPFEHLPPEQQAKDHLFKAICNALERFVAPDDKLAA